MPAIRPQCLLLAKGRGDPSARTKAQGIPAVSHQDAGSHAIVQYGVWFRAVQRQHLLFVSVEEVSLQICYWAVGPVLEQLMVDFPGYRRLEPPEIDISPLCLSPLLVVLSLNGQHPIGRCLQDLNSTIFHLRVLVNNKLVV